MQLQSCLYLSVHDLFESLLAQGFHLSQPSPHPSAAHDNALGLKREGAVLHAFANIG